MLVTYTKMHLLEILMKDKGICTPNAQELKSLDELVKEGYALKVSEVRKGICSLKGMNPDYAFVENSSEGIKLALTDIF